ncbi:MAG: DUF255 domain-containing protein [Chloroflexia bacterium]|nr:DUF255 domain-containing protein [Chloroflexia bacterium]
MTDLPSTAPPASTVPPALITSETPDTPDAPDVIEWLHDRKEAMTRARAERRPVLIDVYQDDCYGCDRLDLETFGDAHVIHAVRSRFIPLKLNLHADREFAREHQVFWTPTILVADRSGRVRYTSPNFLPPGEFLDLLDIGEAMVLMRWRAYEESLALLAGLEYRSPNSVLLPEAIYWRGIAAYFRDGRSSVSANAEWAELLSRFPDTIWAKRVP